MKTYHFIGIGGIGMGALALLLLEKGMTVSGSDRKANAVTKQLEEKGAKIFIGHDPAHVCDQGVVVYSSAVAEDNPERVRARELGKTVLSRAGLLRDLIKGKIGVTVAGAHGKTTTSAMGAELLRAAGLRPTACVGGIMLSTGTNAFGGDGPHFVAELDESDGSFLKFHPEYSIITNIDYEHPDYYENLDAVLDAYRTFMCQTPSEGMLIACGDDAHIRTLINDYPGRRVLYGLSRENDVYAEDIVSKPFLTEFTCCYPGKFLSRFTLRLNGTHNVLNALAVIVLGVQLGLTEQNIREALGFFLGVKRRFQLVGEARGVRVVDDYAHHPTEIRSTVRAARQLGGGRLLAVFQPHRHSRFEKLFEEFLDCFNGVDRLIVTDIYAAGENFQRGKTVQEFVEKIRSRHHIEARYARKEEIVPGLLDAARKNDLILTLGAGDITKIAYDFHDALAKDNTVKV